MKESKFLINVVKEASKLIKNDFEIKDKDDKGDLVTSLDYAVEMFIIDKIKEEYPDFDIISEEYNSSSKLTDNCFTIDPIDGTINFANNLPLWVIQVACIKNKKVVAAVLYAPVLNELYYADETGAYLNDKKIHVSDISLDRGLYTIDGNDKDSIKSKIGAHKTHYRCLASCGISFCFVASGRLVGQLHAWNPSNAWDYVPGMYLVEKAGGYTYSEENLHIGANTKENLEILKKSFKNN